MHKDFEIDLRQCLSCLETDGIFLYPTDTVWGLGADASNETAVQRIMHLKNRPANKSFVVLVADQMQLAQYVTDIDQRIQPYLRQFHKPTTVIYPGAHGLAPTVIAADGSVAIRICNDPFCQELLRRSGKALLSTSANLSGQAAPALYAEIDAAIIQGVDYVVRYRQDETERSAPSTIIKWRPDLLNTTDNKSPIEIIRN